MFLKSKEQVVTQPAAHSIAEKSIAQMRHMTGPHGYSKHT